MNNSQLSEKTTVVHWRGTFLRRLVPLLLWACLWLWGGAVYSQANSDCLLCHSEKSLTMKKKGKSISLYVDEKTYAGSAHGDLECVACHESFKADDIPHARTIRPVSCANCHGSEREEQYSHSVHGIAKKAGRAAATCADCHTTHAIKKISDKQSPEAKEFAAHMCEKCHVGIAEKYMQSDHGLALMAGIKGAPSCIDCHGEHNIVSHTEKEAPTSRVHESEICMGCHLDNPKVRARVGPSAGFISSYENSVHGEALKHGNEAAATCTDCHGSHEMKKGANPSSRVAKAHIATTCGGCHGDIKQQFDESVHGKTLAAGVVASPTCTDCHGEHNILSPKDERAPVAAKNVSAQVCSPCHASVRLTEKYGLASDRFRSFQDSYHGLANRAGSVEVANCASCHGIHDIKPSSDPTSRVHKANLVVTCGACHPGANENFAKGSVHVIATSGDDEILYFVATAYIVLIVVTIGGMFFHNLLDFIKKSKRKLMQRRGLIPHHRYSHRLYLRMSLSERLQHGTLLVSFILLVITGFALKYPDAWWVESVRSLSPAMFDWRGIVHRVAGVVMVAAGLYHIYYVLFVPRGKQLIRDLLPVRQDMRHMVGMMRYNLGFSPEKPRFGRFSYIEKSEYWALVWGSIVMGITGVILWFDNTFLGLITKLWWDVARTIHFYEAWLATLAIVVWHFYFVIFNPDIYPMNLAWWKGTLTEEEMDEEHPVELEEITGRRALEEVEAGRNDGEKETERVVRE